MRHLLKDKKISVWRMGTKKVNGVNVTKYEPIAKNVWAHYQQMQTGSTLTETNGLMVYDSQERAQFVINYRADVQPTPGDLVVFRNKFYAVSGTDTFEGYTDNLKILCDLAEDQDAETYTDKGVEL